jgi:hypothetical protein
MPASKIMLIRHAEKPTEDGKIKGVAADGKHDDEELIVRGWQRSGALVRFFAPRGGIFADRSLAAPKTIFAAGVGEHSHSLRPQHTVLELANATGVRLDLRFRKGDEADLAKAALAAEAPVLIAWQHEAIPGIVAALTGDAKICPPIWSGARFDMVWVLDRQNADEPWRFAQVPQLLLAGDSARPIP